MAPPLRSYGAKKDLSRSTSESKMNALFANNIFARKQTKVYGNPKKKPVGLQINDLPPVDDLHKLLDDSDKSFHVKGKDDTFEMLKNPPRKLRKNSRKETKSECKTESPIKLDSRTCSTDTDQGEDKAFEHTDSFEISSRSNARKVSPSISVIVIDSSITDNEDIQNKGEALEHTDSFEILSNSNKRKVSANTASESVIELHSDNDDDMHNSNKLETIDFSKEINFGEVIHYSLDKLKDTTNINNETDQDDFNLCGAAKRKKTIKNTTQQNTCIDSQFDISMNKCKGKFIVCSTPIIKNKRLKRTEILTPIRIQESASSQLLEESIREIYSWNYQSVEPSDYDTEIRRSPRRRLVGTHLYGEPIASNKKLSRKFAQNHYQENWNPLVQLKRLSNLTLEGAISRQCNRYKDDSDMKSLLDVSKVLKYDKQRNVNNKRSKYVETTLDTFEEFCKSYKDSIVVPEPHENGDSEHTAKDAINSMNKSKHWHALDISNQISLHTETNINSTNTSNDESTSSTGMFERSRFVNKRRQYYPRKAKSQSQHESTLEKSADTKLDLSGSNCYDTSKTGSESNKSQNEVGNGSQVQNNKTENTSLPLTSINKTNISKSPKDKPKDVGVFLAPKPVPARRNLRSTSKLFVKVQPESITNTVDDKMYNKENHDGQLNKSDYGEDDCFGELEPVVSRITLVAGKTWRRSLAAYKKHSELEDEDCLDSNLNETTKTLGHRTSWLRLTKHDSKQQTRRQTSRLRDLRGYEESRRRETFALEKLIEDISLNVSQLNVSQSLLQPHPNQPNPTARDIVLQRCKQEKPLNFTQCYPITQLESSHKIGEGVYGEVFLYRNKHGAPTVMKVIPIEGELLVNGEKQKKFEEIITEIIIAAELSNLRNNKTNQTSAFNEVEKILCVQGKYPDVLLDRWELYDENKGSENDCPDVFTKDQLYIVLELSYGGSDLESFAFMNYLEIYNLFMQVAMSLAVAEKELQFEHRDLHWGNVLIKRVEKNEKCVFNIDGSRYVVPTEGVQGTIIDFTLSRITYDEICIFNDLSQDPDLFNAEGDYQFEIYRQMQKTNGNNWEKFTPYTNVLWLHYLLNKMTVAVNMVKNKRPRGDKQYLNILLKWEKTMLNFKSAEHFVKQVIVPQLVSH